MRHQPWLIFGQVDNPVCHLFNPVTEFLHGVDGASTITVSLAAGTDKINGGTAGVSLTVPQGYSTTISTDAAGN